MQRVTAARIQGCEPRDAKEINLKCANCLYCDPSSAKKKKCIKNSGICSTFVADAINLNAIALREQPTNERIRSGSGFRDMEIYVAYFMGRDGL